MKIWTIMNYELRRLLRSRSLLINQFLLPLVLIFLLGSALSGVVGMKETSAVDPVRVGILWTAENGTESSKMIDSFLGSEELKKIIIPIQSDSRSDLESGLRSEKYGYGVVIPTNFDAQVQRGGEAKLEFILGKDSMDNLVAGTVFDNFLGSINYRQAAAMKLGTEVLTAAAPAADERSSVALGKLNDEGDTYTAVQFYAASMLLMFLLYSGLTVISSLYSERENHTLHRINSMPVKGTQLFTGKILGIGLVTILQCSAIILLTDWLYGVDWGNRPGLLILTCALMIIASMTISIIVAMFFKTAAGARTFISILTVVMTFISGGMFPLPESWVDSVGSFTVNHWALRAIVRIILHAELPQILPNILMLSYICLFLFVAALISYRKVGYHE
ncbi:ABC transporter permease [Paenibacillus sp. sgz500958]|uniref:ABC transporter permease n=1 Tax=Paenibacillus sp. sgz500958 TaxID=3242475 RepID=UPI0036D39A14